MNEIPKQEFNRKVIESLSKQNVDYLKPFRRFLLRELKDKKKPMTLQQAYDSYNFHFLLKGESYPISQFINELSLLISDDYLQVQEYRSDYYIGLRKWFDLDFDRGYMLKLKYQNKIDSDIIFGDFRILKEKYDELNFRFSNQ